MTKKFLISFSRKISILGHSQTQTLQHENSAYAFIRQKCKWTSVCVKAHSENNMNRKFEKCCSISMNECTNTLLILLLTLMLLVSFFSCLVVLPALIKEKHLMLKQTIMSHFVCVVFEFPMLLPHTIFTLAISHCDMFHSILKRTHYPIKCFSISPSPTFQCFFFCHFFSRTIWFYCFSISIWLTFRFGTK